MFEVEKEYHYNNWPVSWKTRTAPIDMHCTMCGLKILKGSTVRKVKIPTGEWLPICLRHEFTITRAAQSVIDNRTKHDYS